MDLREFAVSLINVLTAFQSATVLFSVIAVTLMLMPILSMIANSY